VKHPQHHKTFAIEAILKHISRAENLQHDLAIFFPTAIGLPNCGWADSTCTLLTISVATIAANDGCSR
jgi:hypothetical protein